VINPMLEAELLTHLDNQIRSAQRLLRLVLDQGEAIRARDTERVLAKLAEIQTEMGRRGRLEQERTQLLQGAGRLLGVPAQQVTLERLCDLITLMRQELAFLSHLVRLVGDEHEGGYQPTGAPPEAAASPAPLHRTLDLKA
jgi:hypothetical protein